MHDMSEALKRRKGKGLDVTIMMGGEPQSEAGSKADEDAKKSDLAPKPAGLTGGGSDAFAGDESRDEEVQEAGGEKLFNLMQELKEKPELVDHFQQMLDSMKDDDGSQQKAMDDHMAGYVSDQDAETLSNRPPRSLGERAKKASIDKKMAGMKEK